MFLIWSCAARKRCACRGDLKRPMIASNPVVEAFVGALIGVRCLMRNRLDIAAQLVCNNDPWLAKLCDQPCHEALGSFRISARLNKNIERITVGVDSAPEPMLHAVDRDHNLIEVPLVVRPWPVTADARSKVRTKSVDPAADCFSADHHATFRKQILNILRTQRKPMVCPDRVSNDFTREPEALQAQHTGWDFHDVEIA